MAARDKIHDPVKAALVKDGWTITDEPFKIIYRRLTLSADLAGEQTLAAERGAKRIVVEIKSFLGPSLIHDLQQALGQYQMYQFYLTQTEPDRILFLAIGTDTYADFLQDEAVQPLIEEAKVKLIVVNLETAEVMQWIE